MPLEIVWPPLALARLQEIRAYAALDNPDAAERLTTRLVSVVQALTDFPVLGRPGSGSANTRIGGGRHSLRYSVPGAAQPHLDSNRLAHGTETVTKLATYLYRA